MTLEGLFMSLPNECPGDYIFLLKFNELLVKKKNQCYKKWQWVISIVAWRFPIEIQIFFHFPEKSFQLGAHGKLALYQEFMDNLFSKPFYETHTMAMSFFYTEKIKISWRRRRSAFCKYAIKMDKGHLALIKW